MQINQTEAVRAAARILGNQAILARALGVTPVTVGQWLKPEQRTGRHVPPKQCVRIEQLTDGQVTRRALRPDDWQEIWPELAQALAGTTQPATETVAQAHFAIKHVEAIAVAAIRQEAGQATAELKHVADKILKEAEPWDGNKDRRQEAAPWDGKTERRKLNAPIDRRVSPESVARAAFLRSQRPALDAGKTGSGV